VISGVCDGARTRTVHPELRNGALVVSSRGGNFGGRIMARAGADAQIRFAAQAFLLENVFLFAASLCAIGYRRDLLGHSFQPFALIALTALAMGTRNCRLSASSQFPI